MVAIGTTLFTGSLDNTVRRWSLKEQDLVAPPPQDIVESLADKPAVGAPTKPKDAEASPVNKTSTPSEKPSLMTEEEERELAELMGSDFEDD